MAQLWWISELSSLHWSPGWDHEVAWLKRRPLGPEQRESGSGILLETTSLHLKEFPGRTELGDAGHSLTRTDISNTKIPERFAKILTQSIILCNK